MKASQVCACAIVMCAAPEVTARCRMWPCATVKSMTGAMSSKSCGSGCETFRGRLDGSGGFLRQTDSVEGMNFLKLVLAGEVEDHAAGVALHGLRSGLLEMNVAGQGCGAKQVLLPFQKELSLVGAAAHFGMRGGFVPAAEFCLMGDSLCTLHPRLRCDVSCGQNPFDLIFVAQIKHRLIRLHSSVLRLR